MAASRVLALLILFHFTPWDAVYNVFQPHRGVSRVHEGVISLRSCGNANECILDLVVERVVHQVKLSHRHRNPTCLPL